MNIVSVSLPWRYDMTSFLMYTDELGEGAYSGMFFLKAPAAWEECLVACSADFGSIEAGAVIDMYPNDVLEQQQIITCPHYCLSYYTFLTVNSVLEEGTDHGFLTQVPSGVNVDLVSTKEFKVETSVVSGPMTTT